MMDFSYIAENYKRIAYNIGEAKAKQIALTHAGVSEGSIREYECELDREDGIMVYEIDFECGNYEYEYEINAITGEIVKYDIEEE